MKIQSKVKSLSFGQQFLHYKSSGKTFVTQGRVTPNQIVWSRPNSNFAKILCLSWLSTSLMKIRSKIKTLSIRQHFLHYKSMGAFSSRGNQNSDLTCPKTLCSLSPTLMILHIKFDQDWPTGLRDIQVWKCGRTTDDDGWKADYWYTISSPFEPSTPVS